MNQPAHWKLETDADGVAFLTLDKAGTSANTLSSDVLLERWRPQIAIVSAGRGNTFGHPSEDVIRRLAAIGATIYRTDRDGQITLETDGTRVRLRTFAGT